jgi:DNA-binding MarR family transcriptional regulator
MSYDQERLIQAIIDQFRHVTLPEFARSLVRSFEDFDYSLVQLTSLLKLDEEGELTIKEIAEYLGRSVSATSRLLDQLVVRGMITRREDEHDRRAKRVAITEQGRALMMSVIRRRADVQLAAMEYLSPDEQIEVIQGMELLVEGVRRRRVQNESPETTRTS